MRRARRFARLLTILSAVIREPGLKPGDLADRIGISERTLFRDMTQLRRLGYEVTWDDGYQVQERFDLDGGSAPQTLARVYEQQLGMLRAELPPPLAEQVEDDVEALAPAALAILFASAIERRLDR
ncbi:MAG TPA: HTH domain-containing protein [Candidatus Dormibacteraeota bacterium]